MHGPPGGLEANDGGEAAAVVLEQAGHVLEADARQRHRMQPRRSVVRCQQLRVFLRQPHHLQHRPLCNAHIHLRKGKQVLSEMPVKDVMQCNAIAIMSLHAMIILTIIICQISTSAK